MKRVYFSQNGYNFASEEEKTIYYFLVELYPDLICSCRHFYKPRKGRYAHIDIAKWADMIIIYDQKGYISSPMLGELLEAMAKNIPVKVIRPYENSFKLFDLDTVLEIQKPVSLKKCATVSVK